MYAYNIKRASIYRTRIAHMCTCVLDNNRIRAYYIRDIAKKRSAICSIGFILRFVSNLQRMV